MPEEHYHCYNRGVDKRVIYQDPQDYAYFMKLLIALNTAEVFGHMRLHNGKRPINPPVTILSFCLLPNHYHIVLRCNVEGGVSKYLQRVIGGYTMYFNQKNNRTGSLFQGKFKAKHIVTDQSLSQVVAYVYRNNLVHSITDEQLFRPYINHQDTLVRGLASYQSDFHQREIVSIIKELRNDEEMK
jgi:REP element-mobilizing transposase RayT